MKLSLPIALLLPALGLLGACSDLRTRTEMKVGETDMALVRKDAAVLYKNTFVSSGSPHFPIQPERWPESFHALAPVRVNAYRNGIALAMSPEVDFERGLYIIPEGMTYEPVGSPRAAFSKLREGVYWYEFGQRKQEGGK